MTLVLINELNKLKDLLTPTEEINKQFAVVMDILDTKKKNHNKAVSDYLKRNKSIMSNYYKKNAEKILEKRREWYRKKKEAEGKTVRKHIYRERKNEEIKEI